MAVYRSHFPVDCQPRIVHCHHGRNGGEYLVRTYGQDCWIEFDSLGRWGLCWFSVLGLGGTEPLGREQLASSCGYHRATSDD